MRTYRHLVATSKRVIASSLVIATFVNPLAMFKNHFTDNVAMAGPVVVEGNSQFAPLIAVLNKNASPGFVFREIQMLINNGVTVEDFNSSKQLRASLIRYIKEADKPDKAVDYLLRSINTHYLVQGDFTTWTFGVFKTSSKKKVEETALDVFNFIKDIYEPIRRATEVVPTRTVKWEAFTGGAQKELIGMLKDEKPADAVADFIDDFRYTQILDSLNRGQKALAALKQRKGTPPTEKEVAAKMQEDPDVALYVQWERYFGAKVLTVGEVVSELTTIVNSIKIAAKTCLPTKDLEPTIDLLLREILVEGKREAFAMLREICATIVRKKGPDLFPSVARLSEIASKPNSPEIQLFFTVTEIKKLARTLNLNEESVGLTSWSGLNLLKSEDNEAFKQYLRLRGSNVTSIWQQLENELNKQFSTLIDLTLIQQVALKRVTLLVDLLNDTTISGSQKQSRVQQLMQGIASDLRVLGKTIIGSEYDLTNPKDVKRLVQLINEAHNEATATVKDKIDFLAKSVEATVDWKKFDALITRKDMVKKFDDLFNNQDVGFNLTHKKLVTAKDELLLVIMTQFSRPVLDKADARLDYLGQTLSSTYWNLNGGKNTIEKREERVMELLNVLSSGADWFIVVNEIAASLGSPEFLPAMGKAVVGKGIYRLGFEPIVRAFNPEWAPGEEWGGQKPEGILDRTIVAGYIENWGGFAIWVGTDVILPWGSWSMYAKARDEAQAKPTLENIKAAASAYQLFWIDFVAFMLPAAQIAKLAKSAENMAVREIFESALKRAGEIKTAALKKGVSLVRLVGEGLSLPEHLYGRWVAARDEVIEYTVKEGGKEVKKQGRRVDALLEQFRARKFSDAASVLLAKKELFREMVIRSVAEKLVKELGLDFDTTRKLVDFYSRTSNIFEGLARRTSPLDAGELQKLRREVAALEEGFLASLKPHDRVRLQNLRRTAAQSTAATAVDSILSGAKKADQVVLDGKLAELYKRFKNLDLIKNRIEKLTAEKAALESERNVLASALTKITAEIKTLAEKLGVSTSSLDDLIVKASSPDKQVAKEALESLGRLIKEIRVKGSISGEIEQELYQKIKELRKLNENLLAKQTELDKINTVAKVRLAARAKSIVDSASRNTSPAVRSKLRKLKAVLDELENKVREITDQLNVLEKESKELLEQRKELEKAVNAGDADAIAELAKLDQRLSGIAATSRTLNSALSDLRIRVGTVADSILSYDVKVIRLFGNTIFGSSFVDLPFFTGIPLSSALGVPSIRLASAVTAGGVRALGHIPIIGRLANQIGPILAENQNALFALSNGYLFQRAIAEATEEASQYSTKISLQTTNLSQTSTQSADPSLTEGPGARGRAYNAPLPIEVPTPTVPVRTSTAVEVMNWKEHELVKGNQDAIDMIGGKEGETPLIKPGKESEFLNKLKEKKIKTWAEFIDNPVLQEELSEEYFNLPPKEEATQE